MNRTRNTYATQRSKAWMAGYKAGHGGNLGATAPYLKSGFTEPLCMNWKDGYERGLAEWRSEQERAGDTEMGSHD